MELGLFRPVLLSRDCEQQEFPDMGAGEVAQMSQNLSAMMPNQMFPSPSVAWGKPYLERARLLWHRTKWNNVWNMDNMIGTWFSILPVLRQIVHTHARTQTAVLTAAQTLLWRVDRTFGCTEQTELRTEVFACIHSINFRSTSTVPCARRIPYPPNVYFTTFEFVGFPWNHNLNFTTKFSKYSENLSDLKIFLRRMLINLDT